MYGTRCSVGSAWMSHADAAAAAPPVAPRTVRNRLRSMTRASVVTHGAVARDVALHVAVDAPAHREGGDLVHLRHGAHVAVAGDTALGAEDLDVPLVWEAHETRECVHARPHGWLLGGPPLAHLLDLRLMGRRRAADHLMTPEAGLHRGDPRLARDGHRTVTVQAGDLVLTGVDVVTEEDGLAGTLEPPRVADDGSLVARRRLTGLCRGREGDRQCDRNAGPDPPTPLRHPERSMANGIGLCCETTYGRRNVAPALNSAQALHTRALFRACQQLMLQLDDVDEGVDGIQVGELHPAPPHAARDPAVADGLARRPREAVGHRELALLALGENERARKARLHGMEVAELAPADLVHPDPFPGGAHEHDLLGDVPERAHALARPLEPLRGARRQILERRVRLGTLARAGVEIGRPVAGRLVIDGNHSGSICKPRVTERKRPASSSRAIETPGTAMRPSLLMLSLITSAPRPNQRALGSTSDGYTHAASAAIAMSAWEPIPDSGIVPAQSRAPHPAATRQMRHASASPPTRCTLRFQTIGLSSART